MRRAIGVALVFVLAAACASKPLDDSPVSDDQLLVEVQHALSVEPQLFGTRISASAMNGVIELSGYVKTNEQRSMAADIARSVDGVRSVINNIHLIL